MTEFRVVIPKMICPSDYDEVKLKKWLDSKLGVHSNGIEIYKLYQEESDGTTS